MRIWRHWRQWQIWPLEAAAVHLADISWHLILLAPNSNRQHGGSTAHKATGERKLLVFTLLVVVGLCSTYLVLYLLFSRLHIKIVGDYFETSINTKTFFNKTFCRSETSANPYTVFTRRKDNKDLIQCPTPGCDGMGHSTGNYSTHRR